MTTMRPTRVFTLIAAMALIGALAGPVRADVEKGTGEFGIDFGFTSFDDFVGGDGPRVAARLGYFFTDVIGIEGMVSYSDAAEDASVSPELLSGYVNAVVNVPVKRNLIPYLAIGVGGAELDAGVADDTSVAMQALGGARFYGPKGEFGLRIEGGVQWLSDAFNESTTYWSLGVGLTWTIGGPHPHETNPGWINNPAGSTMRNY